MSDHDGPPAPEQAVYSVLDLAIKGELVRAEELARQLYMRKGLTTAITFYAQGLYHALQTVRQYQEFESLRVTERALRKRSEASARKTEP